MIAIKLYDDSVVFAREFEETEYGFVVEKCRMKYDNKSVFIEEKTTIHEDSILVWFKVVEDEDD